MIKVKKYGACTEDYLPFDTNKVREKPSKNAFSEAQKYKKCMKKLNMYKLNHNAE